MQTRKRRALDLARGEAAVFLAALVALPTPAHACGGPADCSFGQACDTNTGNCVAAPNGGLPSISPGQGPQTAAVVSSSLGFGLSVFGLIFAGVALKNVGPNMSPSDSYGLQVGLYTSGAVLAALGGLGIGIQATVQGPCPFESVCQITYGLGATSVAVGGLLIGEGIYVTSAARGSRRRAWIVPTPLVVPGPRGTAFGVRISGVNF